MKFQAIKGVRDILPPESALWNRVEQTAREVFGTFGFAEIRLPIFEPTDLFARSIGVETDVVSKEMYTFIDRASGELANLRQTIPGPLGIIEFFDPQKRLQDLETYRLQLKKGIDSGDVEVDQNSKTLLAHFDEILSVLQRSPGSSEETKLRLDYVSSLVTVIPIGVS